MKRNIPTLEAKSLVLRFVLGSVAVGLPWCSKNSVLLTAKPFALQWPQQLNASLEEVDPDLYDIIEKEKNRQYKVLCYDYLTVFGNRSLTMHSADDTIVANKAKLHCCWLCVPVAERFQKPSKTATVWISSLSIFARSCSLGASI